MAAVVMAMPGNEHCAQGIATALGVEPGKLFVHRFPDGESLVRVDTPVAGATVALVCTLRDPDRHILPLLFAARLLRESGARTIGLVAPYLAYMRQDRRFRPGEALTSVDFASLISDRFDWLVTIDPHLHRFRALDALYRIPAVALHCGPLLASYVRGLDRPLLIGPDIESEQWVAAIAGAIGAPHLVLEKTRLGDREVHITVPAPATDHAGTAVLVDDIISSAGTMLTALHGWPPGLRRPVCLGIHAVFSRGAYQKLVDAKPTAIVTTNTIAHPTNAIDVICLLAQEVRRQWRASEGKPR